MREREARRHDDAGNEVGDERQQDENDEERCRTKPVAPDNLRGAFECGDSAASLDHHDGHRHREQERKDEARDDEEKESDRDCDGGEDRRHDEPREAPSDLGPGA